jgi:hypothetical protein
MNEDIEREIYVWRIGAIRIGELELEIISYILFQYGNDFPYNLHPDFLC